MYLLIGQVRSRIVTNQCSKTCNFQILPIQTLNISLGRWWDSSTYVTIYLFYISPTNQTWPQSMSTIVARCELTWAILASQSIKIMHLWSCIQQRGRHVYFLHFFILQSIPQQTIITTNGATIFSKQNSTPTNAYTENWIPFYLFFWYTTHLSKHFLLLRCTRSWVSRS